VLLIEPGLFFKNEILMHPCLPVFTLRVCMWIMFLLSG